MPRVKRADPPIRVNITLPESVIMRMELVNLDPFLMRARSGSRSEQITALLISMLFKKGEYMPENREVVPATLDPETVTLQDVIDFRKRLLAKEKVSLEDLRTAYAFTRQSRIAAVSMNGKAKGKEKPKPRELSDSELKDLLPELDLGSLGV